MIIPLEEAEPNHGGKAAGLGRALRAGHPVPPGLVVPATVPAWGLADALPAWVDETDIAVRSSASVEDGLSRSAAGMYDTVLGVRGRAAVIEAVSTVRKSLASVRAQAYQQPSGAQMHVIVQREVRADLGGVLLTDGPRVVLECAPGGPVGVVSGTVTPERYAGTGPGAGPLSAVARLGRKLVTEFGHDVDIEWALDGGQLWLLQVRAVTAPLGHIANDNVRDLDTGTGGVTGTGASPGVATGPVRVVDGPADFPTVQVGDVLVCRTTDPAWTPLLQVVAAVVTEVGGVLSHAAIVARERGVPAVVGLESARDRLRAAQRVTVDGSAGTVARLP